MYLTILFFLLAGDTSIAQYTAQPALFAKPYHYKNYFCSQGQTDTDYQLGPLPMP